MVLRSFLETGKTGKTIELNQTFKYEEVHKTGKKR